MNRYFGKNSWAFQVIIILITFGPGIILLALGASDVGAVCICLGFFLVACPAQCVASSDANCDGAKIPPREYRHVYVTPSAPFIA